MQGSQSVPKLGQSSLYEIDVEVEHCLRKHMVLYHLKLRHPRCVCNNEVKDNVDQNTTILLAGC